MGIGEILDSRADWLAGLNDSEMQTARMLLNFDVNQKAQDDRVDPLLGLALDDLFGFVLEEVSEPSDAIIGADEWCDLDAVPAVEKRRRRTNVPPGRRFVVELHKLLCGRDGEYDEERKKLLSEYRTGQTTFAAAIASTLSSVLGATGPSVSVAVAVCLTIIGRVGLSSWCEHVSARYRRKR